MPPREDSALLQTTTTGRLPSPFSYDGDGHCDEEQQDASSYSGTFACCASSSSSSSGRNTIPSCLLHPTVHDGRRRWRRVPLAGLLLVFASLAALTSVCLHLHRRRGMHAVGPYRLVERHAGRDFFDHYGFYAGADSVGSAGYQIYVGWRRAADLGLVGTYRERDGEGNGGKNSDPPVYVGSAAHGGGGGGRSAAGAAAAGAGPRESVRLEGRRRYDRGLFVFDVERMPSGCGVWPALWLTDESSWPRNGEIDVVEGVNLQTKVKTAMHTSKECDMYGHVAEGDFTGSWDRATGLPEFQRRSGDAGDDDQNVTTVHDYRTDVPADDCYVGASHRWANQGCVAVHQSNGTIGRDVNEAGGAVYVLDWDPAKGHIRSWAFRKDRPLPGYLREALDHDGDNDGSDPPIDPDSEDWGLPYAYFAIGDGTGCSSDHFSKMRLVLNTAFCGTVAGNRFLKDCPELGQRYAVYNDTLDGGIDPIATCEAYVAANPDVLNGEAYWKIRGIHVYERT